MRRPLHFLFCLALAGCAWGPGQGFAVVEPTVRVAYEAQPARNAGDGYQKLASDYQVRLDSASMRLDGIELIAISGGSGGAFDPANPPPRYSLCHGGHCHRDDGALIPYEQIAAEMGGGGGSSTVVTLPVEEPINLLAPETRAVGCQPECALPQTQVSQGRWGIKTLRLEGTVRDGRVPPRIASERRFVLDRMPGLNDAPVAVLTSQVDLPSDRENPPEAKVALRLVLTAQLFDTVDWSTLAQNQDGVVDFGNPANAKALEAVLEQLARISPQAEVTRG
ncbi:hypothetical protein [Archangium sp.]|uniref:hypothetical protein n=1 Tax=Archangium sp. TaxID=1872627 RepID=UPI00286C668A|nr:hypothetical protein [Archangium sp.]